MFIFILDCKLRSETTSSVTFKLGVNDRNNPESWSTSRTVSKMFIHPSYNSNTMKNDITLFKLSVNMLIIAYLVKIK